MQQSSGCGRGRDGGRCVSRRQVSLFVFSSERYVTKVWFFLLLYCYYFLFLQMFDSSFLTHPVGLMQCLAFDLTVCLSWTLVLRVAGCVLRQITKPCDGFVNEMGAVVLSFRAIAPISRFVATSNIATYVSLSCSPTTGNFFYMW